MAKKRAGFQRHLMIYLIVIAFLWALYLVTTDADSPGHPWPIWATLGWGIGLFFNFIGAYGGSKDVLEEREYEKLKRKYNS